MKKRLLSMLLALVLAVSLLPISASAATTKLDGVVYTTVSTAKELSDALAKGGNILLTNDITLDLTFANAFSVKQGTLLNGNGYSIVCSAARIEPLFCYEPGTEIGQSATYIKNLNFGTASVPMKLAGQVALFLENGNDTTYVIYENVNFFVKGSNLTGTMGALYKSLKGVTYIYGCTLNADLTYTGSGLFGAWFGEINGAELVMNDCTTTGTIKGNGLCTAGILGQSGAGNSRFTNCINLANITGAELTAGLAGNVGTAANSMYFSNCKNFGNITSRGTKYSGAAGGILARSSNANDQGDKRLRVFYDCINYGTITAGARAGGILGTSHDWDTAGPGANYAYYTFGGCINYGMVSAGEYAGGIMGIASPATYRAEITDCINVGKISSTKGYAGNFAGMLCSGVITGGYAAGVVSSKMGTDPIVPCVNGGYTLQEGPYEGKKWSVTAPSLSGVTYIGSSDKVGKGVTKATGEAFTAALQAMSSVAGVTFVEADSDDANACVVAAEPIVRGVQQSVNIANGALSFRFAAGLNARKGLASFGFRIKIHENGQTTERTVIASALYTSLNATSDGKKTVVSAESLGSNYLYTATVDGITVGSGAIVEVTPYTVNKNGTVYNGNTRVIYCDNNDCRIKPLMLNGTALESYVIVYAKSDSMSEQLLATRMSDEIAKLTGIALPVLSDAQGTSKKAKIVIGKSSLVSGAVTGRTLRTQGDASVIVISGTNTGELSESIDYFVSNIEQRMIAGNNSWSFTSVDVPVDDEITLMAFNMGAKDNANIKKAEWDLIVDYLPDIWTSQEPWAGFLDDFLNDYAVKPATKFQQDATDDDVMKSDVNNKAFTGSGYYGVYWGLPRWVPGDANTNGKASYSVILYAKDRFTPDLTRSGTFWLSEKVNTSGSTYTGSNFPRCATYLTLTDNNTGKTFTVVNVHLDFVASVQIAQVNILLRELKARLGADMPIFVTGDMNSEAHSTPIALYKNNDYMDMTAMDEVAERSYRVRRNIDWFFTNHPEQVEISYYNNCFENTYLNNQWNSSLIMCMPSDHPAIYTEFKFR